jgi:chemotaxis family two-component system sensor kinase Cph1
VRGTTWQFSIKGNGIGLDMQYADKIFTIFQRLHTNEQHQGTGLELVLYKMIVERHNGKIWVESKLVWSSDAAMPEPDESDGDEP